MRRGLTFEEVLAVLLHRLGGVLGLLVGHEREELLGLLVLLQEQLRDVAEGLELFLRGENEGRSQQGGAE